MKYPQIAIRVILSIVMLYFIYPETGAITTIAFALMFISSELQSVFMTKTNQNLRDMLELVKLK